MRMFFLMELVLAAGVGFGVARLHLGNPDWSDYHPANSWIDWSEDAIDCVLAGTALVLGLGTITERALGKLPPIWGPGRWLLASLSIFLPACLLAEISNTIVSHRLGEFQNSVLKDILHGLRGRYYEFLPADISYLVVAMALTWWIAPGRRNDADAREWTGRAIALLIVGAACVFRLLQWSGFRETFMGGGLRSTKAISRQSFPAARPSPSPTLRSQRQPPDRCQTS